MAETALGMATTLVGSALGVASSAAREEVGLLIGVQDHIWFISDELKIMHAFLRTAGGERKNTEVLKAYLEQIRDLAYDIEDSLEEFMIFIKHRSLLQQLLSLGARHRIAIQIRAIRQRVQEMSQRNQRYNLIQPTHTISDDKAGDVVELPRNLVALYIEEAQLVGFDMPKTDLLKLISSKTDGRKVITVVGMGGLGKTTLARKVYDFKELSAQFDNRTAWITVSQSFNIMELLKDLIMQLLGSENLGKLLEKHQGMVLQVRDLTSHLQEELHGRRYFVVLDDLWTIEAWNSIQLAFPEHSSENGCVVVTTRNGDVAEVCSSPYPTFVYRLKSLEKEDAKQLLIKKAHRIPWGPGEDKIVDEILKKCGGLPLAIVTIGGLLANKDTSEWKGLLELLPSELASNPSLEALRQVVTLSYNHLPSHLKPCFLHLSIFPEDFEINRKHLVNRWIAEGFITSGTTRRTLEDVSESYFYELISRSMIQPSKFGTLGNVKTCKVHDIVHDIAVSISRQENQVFLVEEHSSTTSVTKESIRHISCIASKRLNIGLDLSRVRTFTVFSEQPMEPLATLCSSKFKMLRVLDLKSAHFTTMQQDINNLVSLSHLKFIHFPASYVYALPRSIGNLLSLQTLDLRHSDISALPKEITKLQSLRSLRCTKDPDYEYFDIANPCKWLTRLNHADAIGDLHMGFSSCWSRSSGVSVPKGMGMLKELQILEEVDIKRTSSKAVKELGELTQLRKLSVTGKGASKKKCKTFCVALEKLCSLRSLHVSSVDRFFDDDDEMLDPLVSISSPLPFLESLKLVGILQEVPAWVGKSVNLVKIEFKYCELKEVEALAELPNLICLRLNEYSYRGEKLVFRGGAFPKLRILYIRSFFELGEVSFEASTAPKMESITIAVTPLRSGIYGISYLPKLKEITLFRRQVANIDKLQDEVDKHPNNPVLFGR